MKDLGGRAGVSAATIARCETGNGMPRVTIATLEKVRDALQAAGIEFTQNGRGVRRR